MGNEFDLKPSFPIAGVADLIANRSVKEAQMRAQQQQQLVQGLQGFGSGVQQLVDRRNAMAQAMAQAQVFSQTPEGQQMMAPTQAPTPGYGAALPPGGQGPAGPTTSTPSPVDINTLATNFLRQPGQAPLDILPQIQAQRKQAQDYELGKGELALKQQTEPQKLAIEKQRVSVDEQLRQILLGIQGKQAQTEATRVANEETNALRTRRDALIKNLSPGPDFLNPSSVESQKEIDSIDAELAKRGQGKLSGASGSWTQTANGTKFRVKH